MMGVNTYAYALSGLPGLPALVGPTFGWALVSLVIAFTVSTVLAFFMGFEDPVENAQPKDEHLDAPAVTESAAVSTRSEALFAPLGGNMVPLHQLSDPVFADEVFGKGIAIVPQRGELRSPIAGVVGAVFATNHAITLQSDTSAEVLIHIGIDTVKLNGRHFTRHVEDGQRVAVGDPLISFDLNALLAENIDPSVIVIVTNTENYSDISLVKQGNISEREPFLQLSATAA